MALGLKYAPLTCLKICLIRHLKATISEIVVPSILTRIYSPWAAD
jgi:hypothetical protein